MRLLLLCALVGCASLVGCYDPTWESLDSRPIPTWYDDAKLGIFIHWGVFSVPSFGSEWFWTYWKSGQQEYVDFVNGNYPPGWTYADFARSFTAEFYNPEEWASIFEASGAKYVVLTSKHHEGYTLWPSKYSFSWNSVDLGSNRNLLGDFATAIKEKTSMTFGLYHSLYEWYNPLYEQDKANKFKTQDFVNDKTMPELYELVNTYEPQLIWSDGDWDASDDYWKSKEFLAWLYNESPVKDSVVTNDRWGAGTMCHHGGYLTCSDRYHPSELLERKWESCMTLDKQSWGFRREATLSDYLTPEEIVSTLVSTVSLGGNLLLNVGPTHDGRIPTIMEERLKQLGQWMGINGEAIYGSQPWAYQNDTTAEKTWYTTNGEDKVYAITLEWPESNKIVLEHVAKTDTTEVHMCGQEEPLSFQENEQGDLEITLPKKSKVASQWAWAFILSNVESKS